MKLCVLDGYTLNPGDNPWDEVAALGELVVYDRTAPSEILARAADCDILLTNKTVLDAEVLAELPRLRFISVLATGVNVVDLMAARARGIPVSNVPEYGTEAVAQHTLALLLELTNDVGGSAAAVARGDWQRSPDFCFWRRPPIELAGRRFGVVGFGRIGRRVAELARAFGMTVAAGGERRADDPDWLTRRPVDELFAECDVISLHCPLDSGTQRLVNSERLSRLQPGALLLNTARGGLVDEAALATALADGRLAGAGLDVVTIEPMRADHPLRTAPNCIITPHVAWAALAARRRLMAATRDNLRAFLCGSPIHVVNAG